MDWQPIETAPKDGTPVLLTGGKPTWVFSVPDFEMPVVAASWQISQPGAGEWLISFAEDGYVDVVYADPMHWMPLPVPPVVP